MSDFVKSAKDFTCSHGCTGDSSIALVITWIFGALFLVSRSFLPDICFMRLGSDNPKRSKHWNPVSAFRTGRVILRSMCLKSLCAEVYSFTNVSRLKTILATLLLVWWIPTSSWCYLERAGLIPDSDDGTLVGESSQTAPCWNVAPEIYKLVHNQREPAPTSVRVSVSLSSLFEVTPLQNLTCCVKFGVSPPELCTSWQFSLRAASAPRAPSFAL